MTDINSSGQKVETRVYRFIYEQDTVRQVKAYSVPNGGNPPLNVPDTVVFEGSDPHGTRATVWDRNTNTYKTATLAAPGAYVEDINWQGLKDRYVANIGSQVAYGQYAASQYQSSYFSNIDPRNPGTGCSLDGQKVQCEKLFRAANNGGLKSMTFSTTGGSGGVGGDTGALAAAFGLAAGQAVSTRRYHGRKRIDGERVTVRTGFDDAQVFDTPPRFEDIYSNNVTAFWQQDRTDYYTDKSHQRQASKDQESHLEFNGCKLSYFDEMGREVKSWDAVSGKPGTSKSDQFTYGIGPIPEGLYSVDPLTTTYRFEMRPPVFVGSPVPIGFVPIYKHPFWALSSQQGRAWGNARTPIIPISANLGERTGSFFIHGGAFPGSAGCIDLCQQNDNFHAWFQRNGRKLTLKVSLTCDAWKERK